MLWEGELGGGVPPTIVQHEDVEAIREGLREGIDEELEHLGVQIWQLQEATCTRRRLHRAIDRAPPAIVLTWQALPECGFILTNGRDGMVHG
jgi:hypothetical protein